MEFCKVCGNRTDRINNIKNEKYGFLLCRYGHLTEDKYTKIFRKRWYKDKQLDNEEYKKLTGVDLIQEENKWTKWIQEPPEGLNEDDWGPNPETFKYYSYRDKLSSQFTEKEFILIKGKGSKQAIIFIKGKLFYLIKTLNEYDLDGKLRGQYFHWKNILLTREDEYFLNQLEK